VFLRARLFAGVRRGVLIAEGVWPNRAHPYGRGINTLTGADAVAPFGGAAFHDNRVALEKAEPEPGVRPECDQPRALAAPVPA
jgi:hypothetical protein